MGRIRSHAGCRFSRPPVVERFHDPDSYGHGHASFFSRLAAKVTKRIQQRRSKISSLRGKITRSLGVQDDHAALAPKRDLWGEDDIPLQTPLLYGRVGKSINEIGYECRKRVSK
ncbi:hypothetical protein AKJ41_01645 [candidate division MSBL1 archaeon SCGC-AAA259O05]|uniref:Uncharacterized protein n=1 Tax=candidate division MSBL1 archaeon SCGC-AAA259O05 TaxID=1698271 RepID=A0A133V4R1_9EURY|nr:hypothetical protein AKJ41_01645 [candidate division MSBL1 archaeon SCGC-AAA259O05]